MSKIDVSVVLGLSACAGALAFTAPITTGVAIAIVLVAIAIGGRRVLAIAASVAFVIGAARTADAISGAETARERTASGTWPARREVVGTIVSSPVRLGDGMRIDVIAGEDRVTLHVPIADAPPLARGDRVRAVAELAPPYRFWNDGTGDPRPGQARRGVVLTGGVQDLEVTERGSGIRNLIDRARDRMRRRIDATFPRETSGMARALVLGEDDLTPEDQKAFRKSGLAHLLAVSGMHLVLVVAGFVAVLRAILVRIPPLAARISAIRVASAIGIPITWIYADLAGGSGSAVRAAWMTSVALLAYTLGRRPVTWRALGISVLAMWCFDPLVGYDLSFLLSAAATTGILALASRFDDVAKARLPAWARIVSRPLATTAAATIACAPILACMAGDLPVSGLLANVIAVPIGDLAALPLCLVHALLEPSPLAERGTALAAAGALDLVRWVARTFSQWGTAPVPTPTPIQLAAFAVLAFGLTTRRPRTWSVLAVLAIVGSEVLTRSRGSPAGVMRVTFLDVGQGDAAIVDLPDGRAIVIDGGGLVGSPVDVGERVLGPVLRARRRSAVDVVVLSHPHPDHFGGLRTGLDAVRVGAFWDTGQGEAESASGGYAELLQKMRSRNARIARPEDLCGMHAFGAVNVEVLAPCPGFSSDDGPNDNSFVIRLTYANRSFLFAGDAERHEESALVASRASLHADVLKVGHHGSRTSSTTAWLDAVSPSVAVISCGVRNRFGHPHATTLASLARARAAVYRTDRDGAITITTDGTSLDVAPIATAW